VLDDSALREWAHDPRDARAFHAEDPGNRVVGDLERPTRQEVGDPRQEARTASIEVVGRVARDVLRRLGEEVVGEGADQPVDRGVLVHPRPCRATGWRRRATLAIV